MSNYIIDGLAVLISLLALIITLIDSKNRKKEIREADKKAERAIKLSEGNIELTIRNSISEGRHRMNSAIKDLTNFKNLYPDKDQKVFIKLFYSALEDLLNHYERGCMLYLDDKIDKDRFRIEYISEIRNLVEKGEYKEKYFPAHTSKYKAILKVYNEWENHEK
jgi:hypothetical protein